MEHIEQAGVHSGDSACSLPPYSLSEEMQDALWRVRAMAKALNGWPDEYRSPSRMARRCAEVNPRAAARCAFVSATGVPLAKIAARCMAGQSLADQAARGK